MALNSSGHSKLFSTTSVFNPVVEIVVPVISERQRHVSFGLLEEMLSVAVHTAPRDWPEMICEPAALKFNVASDPEPHSGVIAKFALVGTGASA